MTTTQTIVISLAAWTIGGLIIAGLIGNHIPKMKNGNQALVLFLTGPAIWIAGIFAFHTKRSMRTPPAPPPTSEYTLRTALDRIVTDAEKDNGQTYIRASDYEAACRALGRQPQQRP